MSEVDFGLIIEKIKEMLSKEPYSKTTMLGDLTRKINDPYVVLTATILSHRTKDEITEKVVIDFIKKYPNVNELAKADIKELENVIKKVGFYRNKAKTLIKLAKVLVEKYNGKIPDDINELLSLPGVGRKTANCVLVYAYKKPAIPVDTHVHRIMNRLGIVETKTPEETEFALMEKIDKKYWLDINETFIRFGKSICKPIKPLCNICTLKTICKYYKKLPKDR
ncbi:MAG: endonuclease III [Thermoproteota archaeon]|jgi:endonuclease-3|nr:endonuclease III [Thermoproteota archaeon]